MCLVGAEIHKNACSKNDAYRINMLGKMHNKYLCRNNKAETSQLGVELRWADTVGLVGNVEV